MALERLLLKCGLSLGDIVVLTAAVRDLHLAYPGRFATQVETSCAEVWRHNPHVSTAQPGRRARAITLDCGLINHSNERPYHYLHAYHQSLARQLGVALEPTAFKGDIHLSRREKWWNSQVAQLVGREIPFWIISAGGKFDVTIKWWGHARYQRVVDHFRGRIQFVQVGDFGHWHQKLDGAIDLRGQTDLRQLIRLVYHSQGVLCGVTSLMHLAAAIETKPGMPPARPCVVVAGAREPVHWEAYPQHQFIHTVGALPCSTQGGCWRARTRELGDGEANDLPDRRCVTVRNDLPGCMDLISSEDVIRRIELYFAGGSLPFLDWSENRSGQKGVRLTAGNNYDAQPLSLSSVRLACESAMGAMPPWPAQQYSGRGIVIVAGGLKYQTCAWVCITLLRKLGCLLPIEVWHLPGEMDRPFRALLESLRVEVVDAGDVLRANPVRRLSGWELKAYAILHSQFEEVLFLDADNVPVMNPEPLFEMPEYRAAGAVFWPDYWHDTKADPLWNALEIARPAGLEFESGQILVNKRRSWKALNLCVWMNSHSDFFYEHIHGDKETFHLAWEKMGESYALVPHPIQPLEGTMCQHDFAGRRIFQHRNLCKWTLRGPNPRVEGFIHEDTCLEALDDLRRKWDGGRSRMLGKLKPKWPFRGISITAVMLTTPLRRKVLRETLRSFSRTDWAGSELRVVADLGKGPDRRARQTAGCRKALVWARQQRGDYVLFLEDDLEFNRFLWSNLEAWAPLRNGAAALASLYNPGVAPCAEDFAANASIVPVERAYGSQALLLRRDVVEVVLDTWGEEEGMQDIRISRLAARVNPFAHYHAPSLVQHAGVKSVWGGQYHRARDFSADWRATNPAGVTSR